ncbi:MAG TPA: response regulator transcription factor [Thermomicrobiaceae bacterium]|nr:response regulator transcription factor [Thermomicrobiaceae bacterium]
MIRVLLVDDHQAFSEALCAVLTQEPDIQVVGQARSVAAVRQLLETAPEIDVAVVDLMLPDGDGGAVIQHLRASIHGVRMFVLTAVEDPVRVAQAVQAGARGVLQKSTSVVNVIDAIRRVMVDQYLLSPSEIIDLVQMAEWKRREESASRRIVEQLTPRERQVLESLAHGLSDKEIAEQLQVRPDTIRTHMVNIFAKLNVGSRLGALIFAIRHGIVSIDETHGPPGSFH